MEIDSNILRKDMTQIKRDLELIKNVLFSEGEFTDWAKKELDVARKTPEDEYISMDEIEKEFL